MVWVPREWMPGLGWATRGVDYSPGRMPRPAMVLAECRPGGSGLQMLTVRSSVSSSSSPFLPDGPS